MHPRRQPTISTTFDATILTNFNAMRYALAMDMTATSSIASTPTEPANDAACCACSANAPGLDDARTATLAERVKALADPTRLRILDLLAAQSAPLCVCEITDRFAQQQPTISHHLRILRQAGLIEGEKRGTWAYYTATEAGKRSMSLLESLL